MFINFNKDFDENISYKIIKIIAKLIIFRNINRAQDIKITRSIPNVMNNFNYSNFNNNNKLIDFENWLKENPFSIRYFSKDEMLSNITTNNIYKNKKQAQNVLKSYEFSIRKNGTHIDWKQTFTIEHVMPKKLEKKWFPNLKDLNHSEYLEKIKYIDTLGNLTLLTSKMNSGLKEDVFQIKKEGENNTEGFLNDSLKINQEFSKYDSWDIPQIIERSKKIVESIYDWFS